MKTHIRIMILLVVVTLITAGSVIAGNVTNEEGSEAVEIQAKQAIPARRQAELVKAELAKKNTGYGRGFTLPSVSVGRNIMLGSRSDSTSEVLVIPSAEIATEEIATITEDMNIMMRIFEKNLQQVHIDVGSMFISSSSDPFYMVLSRGKQSTHGMYLQGYGALFLMKVDFPLSPGPQVEEETETQKEEGVDPVWTEMKQEIYDPEESKKHKTDQPKKEYNAEKVENLKTTLVKSLKHAANIRSLKPDELVILTVTGSGTSSGYKSVSTIPGRNEVVVVDHNNRTQIIKGDLIGDIGLSLPTVLVIRAKKSVIDSHAKGDLDFDQFQKNTQILTSAYLADQSRSGGSMIGDYYGSRTNR